PPVPDFARLPRRAPVLHVVLGGTRHGPPRRRRVGRWQPEGVRPDGLPGRVHLGGRAGDGVRFRRAGPVDHLPARTTPRDRGRPVTNMASRGSKPTIGLREMAHGWRWGGRMLVPASAQQYQPPLAPREFPTAWARWPAVRVTRAALLGTVMSPMLQANLTPV